MATPRALTQAELDRLYAIVESLKDIPNGGRFPATTSEQLIRLFNDAGYACCECVQGGPTGKSCKEFMRDMPYAFLLGIIWLIFTLQNAEPDPPR